jgi:hypothetical protein
VSPDDIEEPDESRKETQHQHEPGHTGHEDTANNVGLQGIDIAAVAAEAVPAPPPFTPAELDALLEDLKIFMAAHPPAPTDSSTPTAMSLPPLTPSDASADATAPDDRSHPVPLPAPAPLSVGTKGRPFLASWSVKEVCAWYLQVEEQLSSSAVISDDVVSFLQLLVKHRIDGARLLAFTSDPKIIPLISPALLSRILYVSSLDSSSQLYAADDGSGGSLGSFSSTHAEPRGTQHSRHHAIPDALTPPLRAGTHGFPPPCVPATFMPLYSH